MDVIEHSILPRNEYDGMHVEEIIGRRAIFTTAEGVELVGVVEAARPDLGTGYYPICRFDDGRWGRLDEIVRLVTEEA